VHFIITESLRTLTSNVMWSIGHIVCLSVFNSKHVYYLPYWISISCEICCLVYWRKISWSVDVIMEYFPELWVMNSLNISVELLIGLLRLSVDCGTH